MANMYTLDKKFLVGVPEIKIDDVIIKVDDRQKTVKKAMKIIKDEKIEDENKLDEVFKTVISEEDLKKIEDKNLSFSAYNRLFELVLSAMTGEDEDKIEQFRKSE